MKIAEYYASLGFRVSRTETRRVDKYLKDLEKRLANFGKGVNKKFALQISSFKVDDKKLSIALGNALDKASTKLVFEISRFAVNDRALQSALQASLMRSGRRVRGYGGIVASGQLSAAEWDRRRAQRAADRLEDFERQQEMAAQLHRNRMELARYRASSSPSEPSRSGGSYSRTKYLHAGGAAGAFMRYGIASLPFIGGVYGLGALNRSNQEAISTRLTTQAVVQSKGYTEAQGKEAFGWIRNLANDVGFNYMDAAPEYNQFLSNALGAGFSIERAQDIFQGFAEYQTAMGVTPARRKLVQNALSQMLG